MAKRFIRQKRLLHLLILYTFYGEHVALDLVVNAQLKKYGLVCN